MVPPGVWKKFHFDPESLPCPFCAQRVMFPKEYCPMCESTRSGIALSIFRNMLIKQGEFKFRKGEENQTESFREVAVTHCITGFAPMLREQCMRYKVILESSGVWFAHVVAYTNIAHLKRYQDLFVTDLLCMPEYRAIRNQVVNYLTVKPMDFDAEMGDMMKELVAIPNSDMDTERVLYKMLIKLEEEERLKIEYPKTLCLGCGNKIKMNQGLCNECQKDETIRKRLSILNKEATKHAHRPSIDSAVNKLGMYTRQ